LTVAGIRRAAETAPPHLIFLAINLQFSSVTQKPEVIEQAILRAKSDYKNDRR